MSFAGVLADIEASAHEAYEVGAAAVNLGQTVYSGLSSAGSAVSSMFSPSNESPEKRQRVASTARAVISQSGGASYQSTPGNLQPSQLIHGRGAEIPFMKLNQAKSIHFQSGEPAGPAYEDPVKHFNKLFRQNMKVAHGFAFKMILATPSALTINPVTRFACHTVFRHNIGSSVNTTNYTGLFGPSALSWHRSLGPDAAAVRKAPPNGPCADAAACTSAGLNPNLISPFRAPENGGFMYSRMNRIVLENLSWNANPFKFNNIVPTSNLSTTTSITAFANSTTETGTAGAGIAPLSTQSVTDQGVPSTTGASNPVRYQTQFGTGGVSYNFHNDGTNPVVVDVVITRIKKGETWDIFANEANLKNAYNAGWNNYILNNKGQVNLQGQVPATDDVVTNHRVPFLPAIALKYYKQTTVTGQSPHPYKQVGRDQFILASGGSRIWSMNFSGLNYKTWDYDQVTHGCDDLTYIVSLAVSGLAVPMLETNSVTAVIPAIIDRRGDACNVSVVGTYTENPRPCYPIVVNPQTFINGVLDSPYYSLAIEGSGLTPIDIAGVSQATRGTTLASSYITLGPTNTTPGA